MRVHQTSLWLGAALLGAAAWVAADSPDLPKPYATPSANNGPAVVDRPAGAQLKVPAGFAIQVWADGFLRPRAMILGSRGEILLADSGSDTRTAAVGSKGKRGGQGAVYVFANGNAKDRKPLIEGLDRPYGLALWKNYLYVAESTSVKRFPYDPVKLTAGEGQEVVSLAGFENGHWTRSLVFDPAGKKMYVGVGSESNVDPGEDPRRAAINRYNPDGTGHELYATGTRNPTGLHFYPGSGTLWASVQERDRLGDDLVPDYFTPVSEGGFYGWPYAYIGPHPDPRLKEPTPGLVAKTLTPQVLLPAHAAVMDFAFYTGTAFPAEYRGGAFLALHGSWNRSKRLGYSVVFVPFRDGKPAGGPRDFLTGWMLSPDSKEVWGRPVGVLPLRDGSLLVSDDGGNKIWRITHRG